jgi:hypothetical protein
MFYWCTTNALRPGKRVQRARLLLAPASFYRAGMQSAARLAVRIRMAWVRAVLRMCAVLWLVTLREARAEEASPAVRVTPAAAAGIWTFAQLVPSPLYVAGSDRVGAGVRWQITPFVYAFGVAAKPLRAFVIEPVARHAGAIELYVSPEWACCAPGQATSWIARGGARLYLPLVGRGEALTGSLGGSYYRAGDGDGASIEAGLYVLFGMLGLTVTVSPRLTGREVISALQIRYF